MSRDLADTIWLARPFHSEIVLTKNEFLYCSLPLFVGVLKGLSLLILYCSTIFLEKQSSKDLVVILLLLVMGVRYLSGGIAGIIPLTTLNKNDSLRFFFLAGVKEGSANSLS